MKDPRKVRRPAKLSPLRIARAEALEDWLRKAERHPVTLGFIHNELTRTQPPWNRRWPDSVVHATLNDLVALGRVRLEGQVGERYSARSMPFAFVTVHLLYRDER